LDAHPLRVVRGVQIEIWELIGERQQCPAITLRGGQLISDLAPIHHASRIRQGSHRCKRRSS
jgi:hypothetical protein